MTLMNAIILYKILGNVLLNNELSFAFTVTQSTKSGSSSVNNSQPF